MELKPERLEALLGGEPVRPVYLIAGPEPLLVVEAADAVRRAARGQGYTDREVFEPDGRDIDWDSVSATFDAPSLFAARRIVEIRLPTTKPGKAGGDVLAAFCANPAPDVLLLVTGGEWSRQHGGKWSEAISRLGHVVVAAAVRPHELTGWVEQRLRSRAVKADREAVQRLVERIEGNLLAAAQEIDKLALLAGGELLDAARMDELVADAARYDVFRLVDSAMNGQAAQVSRMLAGLKAEGQAVPALMGMIVMELTRGAALAAAQSRGGNLATEFKAQRVWDSKQAVYRRALQRHAVANWERFVTEAGRVDRISKGRAAGDAWQVLERLLLSVAGDRALPLLAAQ